MAALVDNCMEIFFGSSGRFVLYRNAISLLGALCVARIMARAIWSLSGGFCAYFLAPWGFSRTNLTKYGSWAVVTGSSEGIGRGYALELARQGLNVVVISRSKEKLTKVAEEIRHQYNREVRIIPVDFTDGQSVYDDIQAEISDLDIAVLVNNVGMISPIPDETGNIDAMIHRNIIEVNCQAMVQMTHLVLPKMVEKNCGIIVNVSTIIVNMTVPLLNVYTATKVFVKYFSDALRYEYKSKGIVVQTVYPGIVATPSSGINSPNLMAPSPEHYTKAAVATIGVQHNSNGYLFHAVQDKLFWLLIPKSLKAVFMFNALKNVQKEKKAISQSFIGEKA